MTSNQLAYWRNVETARHNQVAERQSQQKLDIERDQAYNADGIAWSDLMNQQNLKVAKYKGTEAERKEAGLPLESAYVAQGAYDSIDMYWQPEKLIEWIEPIAEIVALPGEMVHTALDPYDLGLQELLEGFVVAGRDIVT